MSHSELHFGTMVNCIDGRTQKPVRDWMKKELHVEFVDAVNVAGPTNAITKGSKEIIDHLKEEVIISVEGHKSENVVIIAHQDCAKNPISDNDQISELKEACDIVSLQWGIPGKTNIVGLWLTKISDSDWVVERLV